MEKLKAVRILNNLVNLLQSIWCLVRFNLAWLSLTTKRKCEFQVKTLFNKKYLAYNLLCLLKTI